MDMLRVAEGGLELLESIPHAKRGSGVEKGRGGGIGDCGLGCADGGLRSGECGGWWRVEG